MIWYFEYEKTRMQKKRIAEANKTVGKPKVGGAFKLVDQDGKPFTDADLKGKYSLVSSSINTLCPAYCALANMRLLLFSHLGLFRLHSLP